MSYLVGLVPTCKWPTLDGMYHQTLRHWQPTQGARQGGGSLIELNFLIIVNFLWQIRVIHRKKILHAIPYTYIHVKDVTGTKPL